MRSRRGTTILETVIAMLVLAAAVAAVAQFLMDVARQQRAVRQRVVAMNEASNALERALALETASARSVPLSDHARRQLPQGTLTVDVSPEEDEVAGRRVTVTVRWNLVDGAGAQSLRLVGWSYSPELREP